MLIYKGLVNVNLQSLTAFVYFLGSSVGLSRAGNVFKIQQMGPLNALVSVNLNLLKEFSVHYAL